MSCFVTLRFIAVPRLAQLDKRRSAEREVGAFNPGRTNNQGLEMSEETVPSLF